MRYSAQYDLSDHLRAKAEIWRILFGTCMIIVLYVLFLVAGFAIIVAMTSDGAMSSLQTELWQLMSPRMVLGSLYSFVFLAVAVVLVAWFVHKASFASLIGDWRKAMRDFWRVVRALIVFYFFMAGLGALVDVGGPSPEQNLKLSTWIMLLPLSLTAIFVQTGAEELAFRGYLQGHLAARFRSPLMWMVLPAAIFAIGHYAPGENGANTWTIVLWAGIFGLATADLTARTGTIGAALGFHFMNNASALLFVSLSGPLSGLSLFRYPFDSSDIEKVAPFLILDLGVLCVSWLVCRVACRV